MTELVIRINLDEVEKNNDGSPNPWYIGETLEVFGNRLKNYCRMPTIPNGPVKDQYDVIVGKWLIE